MSCKDHHNSHRADGKMTNVGFRFSKGKNGMSMHQRYLDCMNRQNCENVLKKSPATCRTFYLIRMND
jgi:hypothetical protein